MKLRQRIGILKSRMIYDFRPLNAMKRKMLYEKFIRPGDLCFDIGAHTGNRSATWLEMKARVIALEPQPLFAEIIGKKFNGNPDFTLLRKAVSNTGGTAVLRLSWSNPAVSTISERWISVISDFDPRITWDEELEIEVTTLDELIKEFGVPDFCKIDVEGREVNVLEGCATVLPALSFEFFPGTAEQTAACIDLLERKSRYGYNMSFTETFGFELDEWISGDEMKKVMFDYSGKKSGDVYAILR